VFSFPHLRPVEGEEEVASALKPGTQPNNKWPTCLGLVGPAHENQIFLENKRLTCLGLAGPAHENRFF